MLDQITGLHHVTALASDARANNAFFTRTLGMRRVKKTVNFDAPEVYHLYYADAAGTPGTVMTYFPFPNASPGRRGTGEAAMTRFAVPPGSLDAWETRLSDAGHLQLERARAFGEDSLLVPGPDGDALALVEVEDSRVPYTDGGVGADMAVRGFHSVVLRVADIAPTAELLRLMGFSEKARDGALTRFAVAGEGATRIDLEAAPDQPEAVQGAGSVHHVAFRVADRARQLEVREALIDAGHRVTDQIDRDYFWAIYFRSPGGVLFEVATDVPGFDRDEDRASLGRDLKLPSQHEHLRAKLEARLQPLGD